MTDTTPPESTLFGYQRQLNDAFKNAGTSAGRIAVVLTALREYAIDGSCDLLAPLAIPAGLELTVDDLAVLHREYSTLSRLAPAPHADWKTPVPDPADTAQACRDAYAALLKARMDLKDAERAHFAPTAGRPA